MNGKSDLLTGLLNASGLLEEIDSFVHTGRSCVLVAMDLDHLKPFNDQYGHVAGDEWIRANAMLFQEAFQAPGAIFGRYGGDEFMAVVPELGIEEIYRRAEVLCQKLENDPPTITVDGQVLTPHSTISMGIAGLPANASDTNELVDKGKTALHRAKISGGNQVSVYQDSDLLTGLLQRASCEQALEEHLAEARKKNGSLSVFLLDIDRFKEINDEYGHRAGDEVLKRLGHILATNYKDMGIAGRMGGDEFIVVLPGQRADSAFVLAEEVRRLVDDSELSIQVGAHSYTLRFRISGGIASYPADAADPVDLLRKADEALYRSKQIGRNRISLPASAQMIMKTSYYTQIQLERLAALARRMDRTEAFLLREALDDLLNKYREGDSEK